jgi:hypothetical protein
MHDIGNHVDQRLAERLTAEAFANPRVVLRTDDFVNVVIPIDASADGNDGGLLKSGPAA